MMLTARRFYVLVSVTTLALTLPEAAPAACTEPACLPACGWSRLRAFASKEVKGMHESPNNGLKFNKEPIKKEQ